MKKNTGKKSKKKKETRTVTFDVFFDAESQLSLSHDAEKIPFPKYLFFFFGYVGFERCAYYGIRAILVLFLSHALDYCDNHATAIFHSFMTAMFFLPIGGAIIADSWLGKFKTIFFLTMVYAAGMITMTLSSIQPLNLPLEPFALLGLTLLVLGAGGAKPCIVAFGADQFVLPQQAEQLSIYFSILYFIVNAGSLISVFLTPIFREDVRCFGEKECFPLALGAPSVLMVFAVVSIGLGIPWYKKMPLSGNMVVMVTKIIFHAIALKWQSTEKRDHWLDYADEKYDKALIDDVKVIIRMSLLFTPIPFFWTLYEQQASRWTFQATRMNGTFIGAWNLKPDQMQVLNPALILIFLPIFKIVIYPALEVVGVKRPLQKMVIGGFVTAFSFVVAAILELCLERTYPVLPQPNNAQLRLYNGEACDYTITTNIDGQASFILKSLDAYFYKDIDVPGGTFELKYGISSEDASCPTFTPTPLSMKEKTAYGIFLNSKDTKNKIHTYEDHVDKPRRGFPYGRTLANVVEGSTITWKDINNGNIELEESAYLHNQTEFGTGLYHVQVNEKIVLEFAMHTGGSYVVVINENSTGFFDTKIHEITPPNSIHMLWMLPQYIVLSAAEIMFAVNGMELSYKEAPLSMKVIVQAIWMLTFAFGNLIIAIIAGVKIFESQAYEFLLFAGLLGVDMCFFVWVAYIYVPSDKRRNETIDSAAS